MSVHGTMIIGAGLLDFDSNIGGGTMGYGDWTSLPAQLQVNGNLHWFKAGPTTTPCTINVDGYSVAFYGITPPAAEANQTIQVKDSAAAGSSAFKSWTYPAPATQGPFFTSARASTPGPIEISFLGYGGLTLNYLLVEVGEFTDLSGVGNDLFVDDADEEIHWSSGWKVRNDYHLTADGAVPAFRNPFTITSYPHGNATHSSGNKGDAFTFAFSGTWIGVYGVSPGPLSSNWQLTMTFELDGSTTTSTFLASDQEGIVAPYFEYWDSTDSGVELSSGPHTLIVTIVDVSEGGEAAAQIDFIQYTPAFKTLNTKPKLDAVPVPSSSVTSAGTASISSASASGSAGTSSTSQSAGATPEVSAAARPARVPTGAIAGGVVGGVVLLACLGAAIWFCLRRARLRSARARSQISVSEPFPTSGAGTAAYSYSAGKSEAPSSSPTSGATSPESRTRQLPAEMDGLQNDVPPPSYSQHI
ncbi:hypothetical protein MKEN_01328500 [Mycena kentingensis (nom. inval.)]|nr:hypothetical protein MKEN_01328500 [Mycena kentingensis (nom. inval.)]